MNFEVTGKIDKIETIAIEKSIIMQENNSKKQFAVCVKNDGYLASLELRKIYEVSQNSQAVGHEQIRVIDESGEDYLYPADYFVLIEVPQAVESTFSHAI